MDNDNEKLSDIYLLAWHLLSYQKLELMEYVIERGNQLYM